MSKDFIYYELNCIAMNWTKVRVLKEIMGMDEQMTYSFAANGFQPCEQYFSHSERMEG